MKNGTALETIREVLREQFFEPIAITDEDRLFIDDRSSNDQNCGFVVDACVKRLLRPILENEAKRFDPFDAKIQNLFIEVKSSARYIGSHLNVLLSYNELLHATQALHEDQDTLYLFFDASEGRTSALDIEHIHFIGGALFSEIEDLIEESRFSSKNGSTVFQFRQALLSKKV